MEIEKLGEPVAGDAVAGSGVDEDVDAILASPNGTASSSASRQQPSQSSGALCATIVFVRVTGNPTV